MSCLRTYYDHHSTCDGGNARTATCPSNAAPWMERTVTFSAPSGNLGISFCKTTSPDTGSEGIMRSTYATGSCQPRKLAASRKHALPQSLSLARQASDQLRHGSRTAPGAAHIVRITDPMIWEENVKLAARKYQPPFGKQLAVQSRNLGKTCWTDLTARVDPKHSLNDIHPNVLQHLALTRERTMTAQKYFPTSVFNVLSIQFCTDMASNSKAMFVRCY